MHPKHKQANTGHQWPLGRRWPTPRSCTTPTPSRISLARHRFLRATTQLLSTLLLVSLSVHSLEHHSSSSHTHSESVSSYSLERPSPFSPSYRSDCDILLPSSAIDKSFLSNDVTSMPLRTPETPASYYASPIGNIGGDSSMEEAPGASLRPAEMSNFYYNKHLAEIGVDNAPSLPFSSSQSSIYDKYFHLFDSG